MRLTVLVVGVSLVLVAFVGQGAAVEGDILFQRKEQADKNTPPAQFPHWAHRIRFKCYVCHEAIFQMKAGANAVSMDAIQEGKFCGACHDGKTAFAVGFETCQRCHRE